jgi:hypothetical protein
MAEAEHLIWKIRNKRVIQKADLLDPFALREEIMRRWQDTIQKCFELDCRLTDDNKYDKRAIPKQTVLKTWVGTLMDEENLPCNWTQTAGVLVGIEPG